MEQPQLLQPLPQGEAFSLQNLAPPTHIFTRASSEPSRRLCVSRLHLAALLVRLGALPRPEGNAGLVQGPGSVQGQPAVQCSTVQYSTVQYSALKSSSWYGFMLYLKSYFKSKGSDL